MARYGGERLLHRKDVFSGYMLSKRPSHRLENRFSHGFTVILEEPKDIHAKTRYLERRSRFSTREHFGQMPISRSLQQPAIPFETLLNRMGPEETPTSLPSCYKEWQ